MAKKKKNKKLLEYQWSGDISRIIPLGDNAARLTNEIGKSYNYDRNSIEFKEECERLDAIMEGKITIELKQLGWNLAGANLTDATPSRADLTEADLTEADLTNADLTGTIGYANLTGADLTGANLAGVNLYGAN